MQREILYNKFLIMQKPLINILTRTSNRPKGFKINAESVKNQTYDNINHIVCTDDKESIPYIKECGVDTFIFVDREKLIKEDKNPNPNTGPYSPHNLYLNEMIKTIESGWIMYVDDDDRLVNNTIIDNIVKNIEDEDTIMYWKMRYLNKNVLPDSHTFNTRPILGRIGGCCHAVHSKWKDEFKWDSWKCSDFRVMDKLHKTVPKSKWLDMIVVDKGNNGGLGRKIDIK
jgi:hypothetical protein